MLTLQNHLTNGDNQNQENEEEQQFRDIHALTPPHPPLPPPPGRRWESGSSTMSLYSDTTPSELNFSMSREFNALVLAGTSIDNNADSDSTGRNSFNPLSRIGEDENDVHGETNPLAIVPDNSSPLDQRPEQRRVEPVAGAGASVSGGNQEEVSVFRVKKEEVESKIFAWQNAKIAKINNRFKREDAIINGWENEQVQKASSWMKKVERKLEEKRAKALEKMQNDVAKARRKAEERRASAEGKRGTKVAKILELANLMKAVGRAPVKRSFF